MASLSGTLATMGPGVPYAIAAKFAHPDRPVIALVGDGAMQMNGNGELVTIAKYWQRWSDPRLIVLVLHNNDLNQVTWEQRAMEGDPKLRGLPAAARLPLCPLRRADRPDAGSASTTPSDVAGAWEQALRAPTGRCVLEAITDPEVPPLPPHITLEQATALALGAGARRPEPRRDRQAGGQGQARRVPAGPMSEIATPSPARASTRRSSGCRVAAYTVPTDAPESRRHVRVGRHDDRRRARRRRAASAALGYTYADRPPRGWSTSSLRDVVRGADALAPQRAWWAMTRAVRNLGRPGVAAMAISAVDVALWDLKARLLDLPLAHAARARSTTQVPVYGSGGFTSYGIDAPAARSSAGWVAGRASRA